MFGISNPNRYYCIFPFFSALRLQFPAAQVSTPDSGDSIPECCFPTCWYGRACYYYCSLYVGNACATGLLYVCECCRGGNTNKNIHVWIVAIIRVIMGVYLPRKFLDIYIVDRSCYNRVYGRIQYKNFPNYFVLHCIIKIMPIKRVWLTVTFLHLFI